VLVVRKANGAWEGKRSKRKPDTAPAINNYPSLAL